jgi:hypothetical protein
MRILAHGVQKWRNSFVNWKVTEELVWLLVTLKWFLWLLKANHPARLSSCCPSLPFAEQLLVRTLT